MLPVPDVRRVVDRLGGVSATAAAAAPAAAGAAAASERPPEEVIVRDAYKEGSLIVIKWESETSNILGFRVAYRLFGQPNFKVGPPLAPSEREFRIKNVPSNVSATKHI